MVGELSHIEEVCDLLHLKLSNEHHISLTAPYTKEEINMTLKCMYPSKDPGPNELYASFYQNFSHVVGDTLCAEVLDILNYGKSPFDIIHTFITLTLKVASLVSPKDR